MINTYRHSLVSLLFVVVLSGLFATSCTKSESTPPLKVGLISSMGGFDDGGFNQQALNGLIAAGGEAPVVYEAREISSIADIDSNIRYFLTNQFNLIITLSDYAKDYTLAAAQANPGTKFLLLDATVTPVPRNMICVNYAVDQASFPCGFLAAYWANLKNAVNPRVAFVGGPEISAIRQFTVSFSKGVDYFNNRYHKQVNVSGVYADSFNDTLQGARWADTLINEGASVVFACAAKTGNGALYKAMDAGVQAIGVDVDQYNTIPLAGSVLLTSCIKHMDIVVFQEVLNACNGTFFGGKALTLTLSNQGVAMAPYHDYEFLLPDTIKQAVENVKTGIMNGSIPTGWPE